LPGAYMWRASYRPIIDGVGSEGSWLEQFGTVILIR
jgi:hypothetical protein